MALAVDTVSGVPGVYRQAAARAAGFPRVRTDVAGFVGVAGPNLLDSDDRRTPIRVDDWRSYEQLFLRDARGRKIDPPAGARLHECVHAFFANGGSRCWVVNVAETIEASRATDLLVAMLGGPHARTGLEKLLTVGEIAIVGLPELDATVPDERDEALPQILADQSDFVCCPAIREIPDQIAVRSSEGRALFTDSQILDGQRALVERCGRIKWRVFAIVNVPRAKSAPQAIDWKHQLTENLADPDCAAIYWPWLLAQDRPGAATATRPPLGHVIGAIARRDLARGPHAAPANETLTGVVGVERPIDDERHGATYAAGVNVIRPFAGFGVQVWGARTLLWPGNIDPAGPPEPLGYVNVRRCLSAIERTAEHIGQSVVFEPNQPLLRLQLGQALYAYLREVFARGAFLGATPEESFYVRCDASNNPPESIAEGRLICEIGVAIAEPAEFIVFRLGRHEGVVEIQEAT